MAHRALRAAAAALLAGAVSCTPHGRPPSTPPAAPPRAAARAAPQPLSLPDHLDDKEFWTLIQQLSEPNGYFRSDNLLSNEVWLQAVIPDLQRTAPPGRVYLGVGPEQNFTYIAALRPAMVFIVDVRRGNLDLHLLYKALFELSADRVDFVARLFARPRPAGLSPSAPVGTIFDAIANEESSDDLFGEHLAAVRTHLTTKRHLPLTADDLAGIEYVYRNFQYYGPELTYWMSGRGPGRWGRSAPTYADLMAASDEDGTMHSYLASEENFATVKALEERNLLVPVVGNFAGPTALRAVARYVAERHALVSAFYLSNVEQYLYMDGLWDTFCGNAATLPVDEKSTFIRAVRSGQYGYGSGPGGLTNVLGSMADETRECRAQVVN